MKTWGIDKEIVIEMLELLTASCKSKVSRLPLKGEIVEENGEYIFKANGLCENIIDIPMTGVSKDVAEGMRKNIDNILAEMVMIKENPDGDVIKHLALFADGSKKEKDKYLYERLAEIVYESYDIRGKKDLSNLIEHMKELFKEAMLEVGSNMTYDDLHTSFDFDDEEDDDDTLTSEDMDVILELLDAGVDLEDIGLFV